MFFLQKSRLSWNQNQAKYNWPVTRNANNTMNLKKNMHPGLSDKSREVLFCP